jgi:exonuclease VII large subunit
MKYLISFLLFFVIGYGMAQTDTLSSGEVKNFVGQTVLVKCKIAGVKVFDKADVVVFLNVDNDYPHQTFSIVIYESQFEKFDVDLEGLAGKMVIVSGTVSEYKGRIQIKNPYLIQAL